MIVRSDSSGGSMRFRFLPILSVVALGLGLPWLAEELVDFTRHYSHLVPSIADEPAWHYASKGVQLALALVAIAAMKWLVPGDYGVHRPRKKSYVVPAVLFGAVLGVAMEAVAVLPNLLEHTVPKLPAGSIAGWLVYEGLYVGPTDEVLYRALLVTYLAATMPGRVRLRSYQMNGAGVVVAAIFALTPLVNILNQPLWVIAGQAAVVFVLGVLFAYWLEKSRSVLAPAVGHCAAGLAGLAFLLVSANALASSS